jgi:hypothetical protein
LTCLRGPSSYRTPHSSLVLKEVPGNVWEVLSRCCQVGAEGVTVCKLSKVTFKFRRFGIDSFQTRPKITNRTNRFRSSTKILPVHKPRNRTWEEESSLTTFTMKTAADASSRHIDSNYACAAYTVIHWKRESSGRYLTIGCSEPSILSVFSWFLALQPNLLIFTKSLFVGGFPHRMIPGSIERVAIDERSS